MKLLKFIGMLLIAMIMCVNFIACVSEPRVFSKDVDGIYYYNGEKIIINNSQFVTSSNDRVTIESLTPHKMVIAWEDDIFCDDEGEWAFVYYTLERK